MSDRINRQKLTTFFSLLTGANPHSRTAADGLAERALRMSHEMCPGLRGTVRRIQGVGASDTTLWMHSLIEWLSEWGLAIERGGVVPGEGLTPIKVNGSPKQQRQRLTYLQALGIVNEEDIHWRQAGHYIDLGWEGIEDQAPRAAHMKGTGTGKMTGEWIRRHRYDPTQVQWGQHVSRHQVWMIVDCEHEWAGFPFEILGYSHLESLLTVRLWRCESRGHTHSKRGAAWCPRAGDWVVLHTPSRGAGTDLTMAVTDITEAAPGSLKRVILSRDYKHRQDGTVRRYIHSCGVAPCPTFVDTTQSSIDEWASWLREDDRDELMCYTDGSFTDLTTPFRRAFGRKLERVESGGALVFMSKGDSWREDPIRVIYLGKVGAYDVNSVYPAEMGSIVMAKALGRLTGKTIHIHSDSEASIKGLNRTKSKGTEPAMLLQLVGQMDSVGQPRVAHVRAHPEKWTEMHEWGQHEMENFIAGKIAGGGGYPPNNPDKDPAVLWSTHINGAL